MAKRLTALCLATTLLAAVSACTSQVRDQGVDSHALTSLAAKLWVDPDGCKHWFIDDGVEGYLSPVLNPDGTPDCV